MFRKSRPSYGGEASSSHQVQGRSALDRRHHSNGPRRSADPRLRAEMLIGLLARDPNVFYIGIKPRRELPVPTPVT
jgi:hypothetical protein